MAPDWEKLAGEQGQAMTSSRLGRLWRVGTMSASVTASTVARQISRSWTTKDDASLLQDSRFRRAQAEKVLKVLGELKGATMKVGQILSSDPELVPPEFADALSAAQLPGAPARKALRGPKDVSESSSSLRARARPLAAGAPALLKWWDDRTCAPDAK